MHLGGFLHFSQKVVFLKKSVAQMGCESRTLGFLVRWWSTNLIEQRSRNLGDVGSHSYQ